MMTVRGQYTIEEILSQPDVWEAVLGSFGDYQAEVEKQWMKLRPSQILFIGCGSTYYLSQIAASLFMDLTGIRSSASPSSELLLNPSIALDDAHHTLLVAISRSGTTTETLQAVKRFRSLGGQAVWGIGCYADSELMLTSDFRLVAEAAHEQSVAQTRSFSSMLLLVKAFAATVAELGLDYLNLLPDQLRKMFDMTSELSSALGQRLDLERMFFLGSGFQYGVANEAMLKMKEMSLTNSEGYHFLEFRHGPMSMANEKALVIGLVDHNAHQHEERVMREMRQFGALTWGINSSEGDCCHYQIAFNADRPAWTLPALYLPPLQLLAYNRAMAKGLNPDNPRNLSAVVSLDPAVFVGE